ncbi:MAG: ABC transporter substrate-binding protein, partial [Bacillota bacterium]|nr:ABC transporter substrate-binding protein [Bacillota bacterium]
MKKVLAIVLAVVMVFGFAACGEKQAEQTVDEGPKVLRVATKGNPIGMSPLTVAVSSSNTPVQQFLYDRLFDFDADKNDIVPMLATAYEYIDATHIRFTIRDDVYCYDGTTKFTASDVAFSLKLACDTGNAANYFNKYFDPAGFVVEDDTHVVIALAGADPFVVTALSNIPYGLICEKNFTSVEALANDQVCGTGPYKMVEWVADSYVKLARNENYWGGKPYFDEVLLQIIPDASARNMALESGDVDICLEPSLAQISALESSDIVEIYSAPTSNNYTLFLNNQKEPFDDQNARIACALALNYEGNFKAAVGEKYGYVIDSILPKTNKYYVDPKSQGYESYFHYDLDKAKEYWNKSKYAGKKVTVELSYAERATLHAYATLIQAQRAE